MPSPEKEYSLKTPLIYTARVISVDTEKYMMRVYSEAKGFTMPLEIPSLAMNVRDGNGAGINFIPEVGSEVWVCETSDGTQVPLMYHGAIGEDYRAGREVGIQGDIFLSTKDGSGVSVFRGGSVLMQSSPVCKTIMEPITDSIRSFCSQSFSYTLSSSVENSIDETTRNTTHSEVFFKNAEDIEPVFEVDIGSLQSGNIYESASGSVFGCEISPLGAVNVTSPLVTVGNVATAQSLVKTGTSASGFLKDLTESLNGLIATTTALEVIVTTLDTVFTSGAIQQALDAQGLAIQTAPLLEMKQKIDTFLSSGASEYATLKVKAD